MKRLHSLLLALCLVLGLVACTKAPTWQEQYDLGVRYLSEGNYQEAIIAFTAAIEIDPKQAVLYIGRADAYIGSGEMEENLAAALSDYEQAVALDETNADAWLGLADVYIRQGEYDKAVEMLKQGLEKSGNAQSIADKLTEIEGGNITDSAGKTRRMNNYAPDGTLNWYHIYAYDDQGRKSSATSFDGAGNQTGYVDCAYNERGKQLEAYRLSLPAGEVRRYSNKFDSMDRLVQQTHYDANGSVESYYISEYDNAGNKVRSTHYRADGTMMGYSTYKYDGAGRTTQETYHDENGAVSYYNTTEYDSAGRETRYANHGADGMVSWYWIYEYNDAGHLMRKTEYNGDGSVASVTTY